MSQGRADPDRVGQTEQNADPASSQSGRDKPRSDGVVQLPRSHVAWIQTVPAAIVSLTDATVIIAAIEASPEETSQPLMLSAR